MFHVTTITTTLILLVTGRDVFPTYLEDLPVYLYNDPARPRALSFGNRDYLWNRIVRPTAGALIPNYFGWRDVDDLEVILEVPDQPTIYTQGNLQMIKIIEDRLFNMKDFQSNFCYAKSASVCDEPTSVIRLFDGTFAHVDPVFNDTTYSNISQVLCQATLFPETKEFTRYFTEVGVDFCSSITSTKTRIFLKFGYPLQTGGNDSTIITNYQVNTVKPEVENIRDVYLKGKMKLYFISYFLLMHDVSLQAVTDAKYAVGSFMFIFVFMWFQTRTFWVTFMGITSILTSFLMTNLIYRFAFGYKYFGFFHLAAMFIILGIGADDVFVFYDTFRLTEHIRYPSHGHRLSDCYRRAATTTFITSLTTTMAFLVSSWSPLLPVASFGIFCGILVFLNYLCDLLFLPAVISVYALKIQPKWEKWVKNDCGSRGNDTTSGSDDSITDSREVIITDVDEEEYNSLPQTAPKPENKPVGNNGSAIKPEHKTITRLRQNISKPTNRTYLNMFHKRASKPVGKQPPNRSVVAGSSTSISAGISGLISSGSSDTGYDSNISTSRNLPSSTTSEAENTDIPEPLHDLELNKSKNKIAVFLRGPFFNFITHKAVRIIFPLIFLFVSAFFIYECTQIEPETTKV